MGVIPPSIFMGLSRHGVRYDPQTRAGMEPGSEPPDETEGRLRCDEHPVQKEGYRRSGRADEFSVTHNNKRLG